MEGSTATFMPPYVITEAKADDLTVKRMEKKKPCSDCHRGTRLEWTNNCLSTDGRVIHSPTAHNRFRLCQACAKKRGNQYEVAVQCFIDYYHVKDLEQDQPRL
jgi:hypothetical protein